MKKSNINIFLLTLLLCSLTSQLKIN